MQGIYGIHCTVSDKWYVGQSVAIKERWRQHRYNCDGSNISWRTNTHLRAAWKKYGESAFEFIVLEKVLNQNALTEREEFWLEEKRNTSEGVYNQRVVADSTRGMVLSRASVEARSLKMRGSKRPPSTGKKISAALKGRVISESTRKKMSAAWTPTRKQMCAAENARAKLSQGWTLEKRQLQSRKHTLFSKEDVAKILNLVALGRTYKDVAAVMGCCSDTILNVVHKRGPYA